MPNTPNSTRPSSPTNTTNTTNTINTTTTITTNTNANAAVTSSPEIVTYTLNETITGNAYVITNTQGVDASGNETTHTTFETTDPNIDFQVEEDLTGKVEAYYDNTQNTETAQILQNIQLYAGKIQCSDFHGKGTIDDYTQLFNAAAKIANESKHMQLDVDIDGFNEFASAADELSNLFTSFIVKLESVSIIDDINFLRAVSDALQKIWKLSEVFGRFKETIIATSSIQLPKSAHDTKVVLESVMANVNCAMKYISHFVDSSAVAPPEADLSTEEKNVISAAVTTIDNWNVLCEQGVSIAMSNNPDIQYITNASNQLKGTTITLKSATNKLKAKLASYNIPVSSTTTTVSNP
jgi:hypothetical protein